MNEDARIMEAEEWRMLCAAGYVHYTRMHPTDSTQDEWEVTPAGQAYFKRLFEDYAHDHPEVLAACVPPPPTRTTQTVSADEIETLAAYLEREIRLERKRRNRVRKIYNGILMLCIIALLAVII